MKKTALIGTNRRLYFRISHLLLNLIRPIKSNVQSYLPAVVDNFDRDYDSLLVTLSTSWPYIVQISDRYSAN